MAIQYVLRIFEFDEKQPFRVLDKDGDPWFLLADVCRELGIDNPTVAADKLDNDEKGIDSIDSGGRFQNVITISESGLYSLIFSSDNETARHFKKRVTSEILPKIRKTGNYKRRSIPIFIDRYNQNWYRVSPGYFSIISELTIRLWGRLEQLGHTMADKSAGGIEIRPDVSVGRLFSSWLTTNHPTVCTNFQMYLHWTPAGEFEAREYPISLLPTYLEFVENVWIPEHAQGYFNSRDPAALPFIGHLLPPPKRRASLR
jgi:BRO family, N-terminal domain